jgi:hypothetical protein
MVRILEVAVGLALVFTLVALICSIITEWISAMLEKRGNLLWEGIENLVDSQLRSDICAHQLMQGLVRKPTWIDRILIRLLPRVDRSKPSYIPTEVFVATLLDIIGSRAAAGTPDALGQLPTTFPTLQTAIENAQEVPPKIKQALLALVNDAGGDLTKAKKYIGDWFDAGMGRASGWYKRWSQMVLLAVSLVVALILGVDSLAIAKRLWSDPILRDQVAQAAEEFVDENQENPRLQPPAAPAPPATTPPATAAPSAQELAEQKIDEIQIFRSQLEALALPMFPATGLRGEYRQSHSGVEASRSRMFGWWLSHHLFGFLLTGLAASLGAPFWFDLLNKIVNLRNAGTKHVGRLQSGTERGSSRPEP